MPNHEFSCDCGHIAHNSYFICTHCYNAVCDACQLNGICQMCIEHMKSVNKLCNFIESNIYIISRIQHDTVKYMKYKRELELLRTIYNTIISGDSIEIGDYIYNYLTESKDINILIENSSINLCNILFTNKIYLSE